MVVALRSMLHRTGDETGSVVNDVWVIPSMLSVLFLVVGRI